MPIKIFKAKLPLLLLALLLALPPVASAQFFRAEKTDGVWWLRDPDGKPFLSLGVCVVSMTPDYIRGTKISPYRDNAEKIFGSPEKWQEATAQRLFSWGFNSLGAWSSPKMATRTFDGRHLAHFQIVDIGAKFVSRQNEAQAWLKGEFPDVFDPAFAEFARHVATEKCVPARDDRWLVGWFIDNELKWMPDWRGPDELLPVFLNAPLESPGRAAAFDLLESRYLEITNFNAVWKTAFADWPQARRASVIAPPFRNTGEALQNQNTERAGSTAFVGDCDAFLTLVAERYFSITTEAIRAVDTNHLVLGCRFPMVVPAPVRRAAAKHCDVISINSYAPNPTGDISAYDDTGRPVLIGEFTFRGADAGLPNSNQGLPIVATQAERAAAASNYLCAAFQHPSVIGAHWFQWADQPKEGRFDGENSNVGLVNMRDEPYRELVTMFARTLTNLISLHSSALAAASAPAEPTLGGADVAAAFKDADKTPKVAADEFWPKQPRFDPDVMLPSAWAFGVLYGAYTNQTGALAKAQRLIAADFPMDALWIDSAFWNLSTAGPDGYINFRGDTNAFPDLTAYWREMHSLGLRNGIWTWERLNNTEANYAEFKTNGYFKEAIIGNTWHNRGAKAEAGLVDFDNPAAASRWHDLMLPLVQQGLDFFKIDASPTPGYIRTHFELSQQGQLTRGGRGFILSHPRNLDDVKMMKGFPACWTSDSVAEWDHPVEWDKFRSGGLKQQIQKYADPNFGAEYRLPFLANDTGGYWSATPKDYAGRDELYQRWVQFSAFGPIMEVFSDRANPTGNEPLAYSAAAQENFRRYTHLRMRLFPYIYSNAHLTRQKSQRMIRGDGMNPTQYWFGEDFWVAPVFAPQVTNWPVALPPGSWINYWTGKPAVGGQKVIVPVDVQTLPLFVRAGAIIPMRNYARTIELGSNEVLTLEVFPHGNSEFTLYEDDGRSLDYRNDKIARTTFHSAQAGDAIRFTINAVKGNYTGRPHKRTYIVKLRNLAAPKKILLNGKRLRETDGPLDATTGWRRLSSDGRTVRDAKEVADICIRFHVSTGKKAELVIQ